MKSFWWLSGHVAPFVPKGVISAKLLSCNYTPLKSTKDKDAQSSDSLAAHSETKKTKEEM